MDINNIPIFLQAHPKPKTLIQLEFEAQRKASANGHKMGRWANNYVKRNKRPADRSTAMCVVCGDEAWASLQTVNTQTGGEATFTKCGQ
jgi:hypothetical protein